MKRITREFLLRLANRIYDPKTPDRFMRLCKGTLSNGPDPKQPRRRMHCGLGELYFAATRQHPDDDLVESLVVDAITDKTCLRPGSVEEYDFKRILADIPDENDSADNYATRARRVAAHLRKAADLLPPEKT